MIKILIFFALVTLTAQTTTFGPTSVDFRYKITWTDPNPAGMVVSWLVYATNMVGSHTISTPTNIIGAATLLNGLPAGYYTVYANAVSALGAESDTGDKLIVQWPGGDGKPHGGHTPSAFK
jgi:hypothetical protein